MTPAPGKKRGRKPSTTPNKVRVTLTLDPAVKASVEAITTNLSEMVETLLRKEIKRRDISGTRAPKMGKSA